jgi:Protein of unknown function (DUF4013)
VLPLGAIPLLGYAVACTRDADAGGPPRWRIGGRLLSDGVWVLVAIAVIAAPFALVAIPIARALHVASFWHSSGTLLDFEAGTAAALILALPWGVAMLALMPHAVARFASSGSARDLFDYPASLRGVWRDFATWNVVAAAIVTAWALGLACVALFCVGLAPGVFYAILVSAHATASLGPAGADPSAR